MGMQRKAVIGTVLSLCLILTAGCSGKPNQTKVSSTDIGTTSETEHSEANSAELAVLRAKIKEADCTVGIAFVDFVTEGLSEEDTATYLSHSETIETYPFLNNLKMVACDGLELFLLVPKSEKSIITVFPSVLTDKGELTVQKDKVIYQSAPGEPIALRCNTNENYSNVWISVTDGGKSCEFSPMISLQDGWSIALEEGCYDFSIDHIRKYVDMVYTMLPKTYPDIQKSLDSGKELVFADDFYFCNQKMLRFELGTYTVDDSEKTNFTCEMQYAVAFDATYAMNPKDHKWYVIGAGVNGWR